MKKSQRIVLCWILAILMTVTVFPSFSFAQNGAESASDEIEVAEIDVQNESSEEDAETPPGSETEIQTEVEEPGTPGDLIEGEESDILDTFDDDLGAGDDLIEESTELVEDLEDDPEIGGDDELGATPSLSFSSSSITLTKGGAKKIVVTCKNAPKKKSFTVSYASNNINCKWDSKWTNSNKSLGLTVTGKRYGTFNATVYMKNSSGTVIATKTLKVTVKSNAKISVSTSSVSMNVGQTNTVNVTISGYVGRVYLSHAKDPTSSFSASWGSWSGNTIPLRITGSDSGIVRIYIYLKDSEQDTLLASASVSVYVSRPTVSVSASSVSLKAGIQKQVTVTWGGIYGTSYSAYSLTNSSICNCSWGSVSGSSRPFIITGTNPGSGTIYIYLKDANKKIVASACIAVNVTSVNGPSITADRTSVSVIKGNTSSAINVTYNNMDVPTKLTYSLNKSGGADFDVSWGSRSGCSYPLTVTGKKIGSGSIKVNLVRRSDSVTLSSCTIAVTVKENDLIPTIGKLSYKFQNRGEDADAALLKKMYATSADANYVANLHQGRGGNCEGMATTAGMLYAPGNGVYTSTFGRSKISLIEETDKSSAYNMTAWQFIKCMQNTQASTLAVEHLVTVGKLGTFVTDVENQINQGYPVKLGIKGSYGGHAVLAYGVERVSSTQERLLLYDNNSPMTTAYLNIYKNAANGSYSSWSFNNEGVKSSSSTGGGLYYTYHSEYLNLWQRRGSLQAAGNRTALSASVDNVEIYDIENNLIAKVENGALVSENDDVQLVEFEEGSDNGEPDYMLRMPVDVYKVRNTEGSGEEFTVDALNEALGVRVATSDDEAWICVDAAADLASVLLPTEDDETYSIEIYSGRPGEPETVRTSGNSEGETISVSMENGDLETCNVSQDSLSLGDLNEGSTSIRGAVITGIRNMTYTGKPLTQTVGVSVKDVPLEQGQDYEVEYSNNTNAGTAKVTISGKGRYAGTVTKNFTISKAKNPMTVKTRSVKIKYSSLKKKNQTIKRSKVISISKEQGKTTFKLTGVSKAKYKKYFKVNSKTGNITVKKGLKKGTFKVKVKVKAAGTKNYKTLSKTVQVKVRVK